MAVTPSPLLPAFELPANLYPERGCRVWGVRGRGGKEEGQVVRIIMLESREGRVRVMQPHPRKL